jgi:hypothetical protein
MGMSECLFCGSTGSRSKEHWMRRQFKNFFHVSEGLVVHEMKSGGKVVSSTRPISQFDLMLNAVCRSCNQGWLNDLENEVLPILLRAGRDGEDINTSADLMERLGLWAVIRALLRTHMTPTGRAPVELFREVHATRRVPRGCLAHWAYSRQYVAGAGVHHSPQAFENDSEYWALVSFGLGGVLVQVGISGGAPNSRAIVRKLVVAAHRWFRDGFFWIAPRYGGEKTLEPLEPAEAFAAINVVPIACGFPALQDDGSEFDPLAVIPSRFHGKLIDPGLQQLRLPPTS